MGVVRKKREEKGLVVRRKDQEGWYSFVFYICFRAGTRIETLLRIFMRTYR